MSSHILLETYENSHKNGQNQLEIVTRKIFVRVTCFVVMEDSPRPRRSSKTTYQVLVVVFIFQSNALVIGPSVLVILLVLVCCRELEILRELSALFAN